MLQGGIFYYLGIRWYRGNLNKIPGFLTNGCSQHIPHYQGVKKAKCGRKTHLYLTLISHPSDFKTKARNS